MSMKFDLMVHWGEGMAVIGFRANQLTFLDPMIRVWSILQAKRTRRTSRLGMNSGHIEPGTSELLAVE